jgi:hypothetical protein
MKAAKCSIPDEANIKFNCDFLYLKFVTWGPKNEMNSGSHIHTLRKWNLNCAGPQAVK